MRIIHVLRKPCSESTVAANTLKHGTGGLNIDASRIAHGSDVNLDSVQRQQSEGGGSVGNHFGAGSLVGTVIPTYKPGGRWPANVILQHLDGCGEVCEPGCPVARLDEQSGVLKSGALPSTQYTEGGRDNSSMFAGDGVFTHQGYKADTGGASRFYKQVGGDKVSE